MVTEGGDCRGGSEGCQNPVTGSSSEPGLAWGGCQSNYCGHKVIAIMSKELGVPEASLTRKGGASSEFANSETDSASKSIRIQMADIKTIKM